MATWYGASRSNFFQVKDEETFLAWAGELGLCVESRDYPDETDAETLEGRPVRRHALFVDHGEGWPYYRQLEQPITRTTAQRNTYDDYDEEIDLPAEIAVHLHEGEVCVLEQSGAEALRYVTGHAVAINHRGETLHVYLDDIYGKVKEAGWAESVSRATF